MEFSDGDILRVVNRMDKPFKVMYDSRETTLMPDKDAFLPFPCVALWFGDPRADVALGSVQDNRGIRTYIPDRETEIRRLRAKYDNQFGDETVIVKAPNVEVYALDGERVLTVLDDPQGEHIRPASETVADRNDLLSLLAQQQRQIDVLTEMALGKVGAGVGTETSPAEEPVPVPEPVVHADSGNEQGADTGGEAPVPPPAPSPPTESFGGTPLLPTTPQSDEMPPPDQG